MLAPLAFWVLGPTRAECQTAEEFYKRGVESTRQNQMERAIAEHSEAIRLGQQG
jgi:hypothetical protein